MAGRMNYKFLFWTMILAIMCGVITGMVLSVIYITPPPIL